MSDRVFWKIHQEYHYTEIQYVHAGSKAEAIRRSEDGEVTKRQRTRPTRHLKPRIIERDVELP